MNTALARVLPLLRTPALVYDDAARREIMYKGFTELDIDDIDLEPLFAQIESGMRLLTDAYAKNGGPPACLAWRFLRQDDYGKKYEQEVGLTHKTDRGENKFVLQHSPSMFDDELFSEEMAPYRAMFAALHVLDTLARSTTHKIAMMFDAANAASTNPYPGSLAERFAAGLCIVRVLRYRKKQNSDPDATIHIDRAGMTPHFWSSHSGLRVFDKNKRAHRISETSTRRIAVFPGEKFAAMTRGRFGLGTPHGVLDDRRELGVEFPDDHERFAIVGFCHPVAVPGDVAWHYANRETINRYEKSVRF